MKSAMKWFATFALAIFAMSVMAEEAAPAEKPARPEPVQVTVTGKLNKVTETKKRGDKEMEIVRFVLVTAEGAEVNVPPVKAKEGETAINLDEFVGKNVTITGLGMVHTKKTDAGEVTMTMLKKVESVALVADAPATE